jgi:hypothetical protein
MINLAELKIEISLFGKAWLWIYPFNWFIGYRTAVSLIHRERHVWFLCFELTYKVKKDETIKN